MKAAVYYGPGDIRIEEVGQPVPGDKGMVLRVRACGVCPLVDIPHYKASYPVVDIPPRYQQTLTETPVRRVLGHEFSGDVVEVGAGVSAVRPGDRVYGVLRAPCGYCEACRSGNDEECKFVDGGGRAVDGAMAEYVLFPDVTSPTIVEDKLIKIPDSMTYRDGALLEPLILGIGLAQKAKAGDVVVVFGQDVMGLAATVRLKEIGVSRIIAVDTSDARLRLSRDAGADVVVNALRDDVFLTVMDATEGRGADLALELSCRAESLQQAVSLVRPFSEVWLGTFYTSGPFFNPSWQSPGMVSMNITQKPGMSIRTAWGTLGPWMPRLQKATEMILSGKIGADKCVTHAFPLEKTREAFETAINVPDAIKVMIEP